MRIFRAIKTGLTESGEVIKNMDTFIDALLSGKTGRIPDEYDWFAPLLGDWDCDYYDEPEPGVKRHVKGEWIFRRILEGTGVQDIFIFPSRATKETEPQPDGEYGSSLRMFNKTERCYDVVYTCDHAMKRLCFTKQGDRLGGKGAFRGKRVLDILGHYR